MSSIWAHYATVLAGTAVLSLLFCKQFRSSSVGFRWQKECQDKREVPAHEYSINDKLARAQARPKNVLHSSSTQLPYLGAFRVTQPPSFEKGDTILRKMGLLAKQRDQTVA